MSDRIYQVNPAGGLEPLAEQPFDSEGALQALIADHPAVLAGEQMDTDDPKRWVLIKREMGIADSAQSGSRWALDHLLVDQDGLPTLVEVKRGSNPEVRRTVVGQLLEYAAHATRYWPIEDLRRSFEASATGAGRDPADVLAELLGVDGDPDADAFWERVGTNLAAHRLRLLFVADEIPSSLVHIVEFLNAQMRDVEVLAVEVKQFRATGVQTLVPRVIGLEARPPPGQTRSGTLTEETFLDAFEDPARRAAAARLLQTARAAGGSLEWGSRGVSVRGRSPVWHQPITVAWLYPSSQPGWMRTHDFSFGSGIVDYEDLPPALAALLRGWADEFRDDEFTSDASSHGVAAWAVALERVPAHIDLLDERLRGVFARLAELPSHDA